MRACWCGNAEFLPFNAEYGKCVVCGTLVSQDSLTNEELVVQDDETDFYGKRYWLGHQARDLGFPDIYARSRNDLTERNLHWLQTLVKYRPPPARTLELGCGHGSFVGLVAQAGYDASGTEMSAWVVDYGKETFGVPIALGPIEDQPIIEGSLDVIVSFDVLEHLPDPLATMDRCLRLLKPEGFLLIQTPRFDDEMTYAELVAEDHPFLLMLQPDEHLYLFTEQSVRKLFSRLGSGDLAFEPAIFSGYDMFFAVGRKELETFSRKQWETALATTPGGRFTQALLDLKDREVALADALRVAEADRTLRGESVTSLTALLSESEADRAARGKQVVELKALFEQAESDRNARGEQIVELTQLLAAAEADRLRRGQQVDALTALLKESEADRAARDEGLKTLTHALQESERDRDARGAQIASLTQLLEEARAVPAEVEALMRFAETADADRIARGEQVVTLTALLKDAEADRSERGRQVDALSALLKESEADRAARDEGLKTLTHALQESERDRDARGAQIASLTQLLEEARAVPVEVEALMRFAETADADRIARGEQIVTLTALLKDAEADRAERGQQIATLTALIAEVESDRAARGAQIETLTRLAQLVAAEQSARERSLAAWRQRVEDALRRIQPNNEEQEERWSEIRSLIDEVGREHG